MSTNCIRCIKNKRTGPDLMCDDCRHLSGMETSCKEIAELIQRGIDKTLGKIGFTLFLFDFGVGGFLTYISNAEREDMVQALKEWMIKEGVAEQ